MKVFLALGHMARWVIEVVNEEQHPNILVSYEYASAVKTLRYTPTNFILDSGAFSAWSAGRPTDIKGYAEWALSIKENHPRVICVNMDVIPGERGRTSTKAERLQGMKDSLRNADWLRDQGLQVMEVFHQDEPQEFLDDLLDRLPPGEVLGLSPRNDVPMVRKMAWHRALLGHFRSRFGTDFPRTHGLAATAPRILEAFPYWSADSTTWISVQRYGRWINEAGKLEIMSTQVPPEMQYYKPAHKVLVGRGIRNLAKLQESTTTLWKQRGISWPD